MIVWENRRNAFVVGNFDNYIIRIEQVCATECNLQIIEKDTYRILYNLVVRNPELYMDEDMVSYTKKFAYKLVG